MSAVTTSAVRVSPLQAWHQENKGQQGARGIAHYGDEDREREIAQSLAICDLSLIARCGFKGAGGGPWVSRHLDFPERPNHALSLNGDGLIARLSRDESLIVDSLVSPGLVDQIAGKHAAETPERCYALPRQDSHGLIALSGRHAPDVLATLCAIDMRTAHFVQGDVAQTSLARLNAIVVRHFTPLTPLYYLFADHCAQAYLWEVLGQAIAEFSGEPVGVDACAALFSNA